MLTSLVLAWSLVVQLELHVCQEGVCRPHPQVQPRSQAMQTLATESDCRLLQLELQRLRQRVTTEPRPRRSAQLQATFVCQPAQ